MSATVWEQAGVWKLTRYSGAGPDGRPIEHIEIEAYGQRVTLAPRAAGAAVRFELPEVRDVEAEVRAVIVEVARRAGVSVADIVGRARSSRVSNARKAAIWIAAQRTGASDGTIGRALKRDRSTIAKARADVEAEMRVGRPVLKAVP